MSWSLENTILVSEPRAAEQVGKRFGFSVPEKTSLIVVWVKLPHHDGLKELAALVPNALLEDRAFCLMTLVQQTVAQYLADL